MMIDRSSKDACKRPRENVSLLCAGVEEKRCEGTPNNNEEKGAGGGRKNQSGEMTPQGSES
jgi:hypothetical protein